jgi:uncharacterized protein YeeX (DUF496 family)
MTILIANIGTSDLTVKIGEYYIPIGFDRSEPNIGSALAGLSVEEKNIWDSSNKLLVSSLCPELGVHVNAEKKERYSFSLRELTNKLLDAYNQDPEIWHGRIRPGRILGVIKEARDKFKVKDVYVFVTNQANDKAPKGHDQDSIFLFQILEKWFKKELPSLNVTPEYIPSDMSLNSQDKLLNYYYGFFNRNTWTESEKILISIKGGTPQMQTALQIQSISSEIRKQLFLDPQLDIKNILLGKPSACNFTSYWQHRRGQKYQTVKQLLERWDFDGAHKILEFWQEDLKWLSVQGISTNQESIEPILKAMELACKYLDLDNKSAKKLLENCVSLQEDKHFPRGMINQHELLSDLYAQCKIKWELDQIPDFLWRMSCLYEETLNQLIVKKWDKKLRLVEKKTNGYQLHIQKMPERLKQIFEQLEQRCITEIEYKLDNRPKRINFINALFEYDKEQASKLPKEKWNELLNFMRTLDYWAAQRNQIIHNANGVSKREMEEQLNFAKNNIKHSNEYETVYLDNACRPDEIINNLHEIYKISADILHLHSGTGYYIYSQIREWVNNKLMELSKDLTPVPNPE